MASGGDDMTSEETRAAILASDDLMKEQVNVPWDLGDAKLYVRALRASEKDAYIAKTMRTGQFSWSSDLTAALLVKVIVDENGARIFSDADVDALGAKDAGTLSELLNVMMRLSGMAPGEAEVIQGNFGLIQSDGSDSG